MYGFYHLLDNKHDKEVVGPIELAVRDSTAHSLYCTQSRVRLHITLELEIPNPNTYSTPIFD